MAQILCDYIRVWFSYMINVANEDVHKATNFNVVCYYLVRYDDRYEAVFRV